MSQDLSKLVELEEKIKELEKQQKPLKDKIKKEMIAANQTSVNAPDGTSINLTQSSRTTFKDKDAFLKFLAQSGLNGCIDIIYEPNLDRALVEVNNGKIKAEDIQDFYKKTDVYTMKIK